MPTISPDALKEFARQLIQAGGASESEAKIVSHSLVESNLRGYDSHGVMRIPYYIAALKDGIVVSSAEIKIVEESQTRVVGDAQWGFGQVQAMGLMDQLVNAAKTEGLGIGTLYHCGHIGRLGEYCEKAAALGLVSMVMVNSHGAVARVAPPGGLAPRLSTNPLGIGVPNGEEPLILDFSTSATAEGKVRVKKIAGESIPQGWVIDSQGNPTTDPNDLYSDPPGTILPMGGDQAYKGFGLSLMIEILTGALSGGFTAREEKFPINGNCVFMLLLNPEKFGGAEHFASEVAQLTDYMRSCPKIDGVEKITLPGDPERVVYQQRNEDGIEFDPENWNALVELAEKLSVEVPQLN